jgi:hypothetical protein
MFGSADQAPARRLRWGSLYALAASMLALFGVVDTCVPPWAWRRTLEIAVIILAFGAIHLWVRANRRALDLAGARGAGVRAVVMPPAAEPLRSERGIEVTLAGSRDSERVVTHSVRRGGKRVPPRAPRVYRLA